MDTLRRTLVKYTLGTTAAATFSPLDLELLERFSQVLSKPSCLDETLFSELETHTSSYWQNRSRATFPSANLLESARAHFSLLIRLLQGPLSSDERARLCAIGSETAQIIGMLLFDLRAYSQARNYFFTAIRAAQEAEHSLLEIVAWGNLSFAWMYDENPQEALSCIQKARKLAGEAKYIPRMISGELAGREAEVHSLLGTRDACLKTIIDAERGIEDVSPESTSFGILHFDKSRWAGYQGACFRRLHTHYAQGANSFLQDAHRALTSALDSSPASQLLRRSTLELDLAEVLLQQKDEENAAHHALEAATLTERTGSQMMTQRLWTFRQQVGKSNAPLIQMLDHQLALLSPS